LARSASVNASGEGGDASMREIAVAAQRLPRSLLYRSPRFSRRSRALLSAFKRGLRRMLASDLVRALANRCLRDIFFVRRSHVWPPSIGKTMCVLPTKTRQCSARPHDGSIEANALPCLGQRLG
jgi:hypothetical protein